MGYTKIAWRRYLIRVTRPAKFRNLAFQEIFFFNDVGKNLVSHCGSNVKGDAKVASKSSRFQNSQGIKGHGFDWIGCTGAEYYDRFVQFDYISRIPAESGDVFMKSVEAFVFNLNKEVAIIKK
ncbi:hypothetical protein LIER_40462 [Lithospermum erythrorhizon]|uniref:Uncharacterized protein n=1 Tax=Lithospermum erythrorhizon TaxID=34254 RepID=A0AAV3QV54_LITER